MHVSTTRLRIECEDKGCGVSHADVQFYFGVRFAELVLAHSDNLSKTLQATKMSASEGQRSVNMTVKTLTGCRNNFGMFWEKVTADAQTLNLGEHDKPRQRKCPRRVDIGNATTAFHPETINNIANYKIPCLMQSTTKIMMTYFWTLQNSMATILIVSLTYIYNYVDY